MAWLFCVVALLVGAAAGLFVGYTYRKKIAEKEIGSAEDEATRIINEAIKGAEAKKREAVVEAREEIYRARAEFDKETKERRDVYKRQARQRGLPGFITGFTCMSRRARQNRLGNRRVFSAG